MIAWTQFVTGDGNMWPNIVHHDGSNVFCSECESPLFNYEACVTLDGEPCDCYFADEEAGVVIVRVPSSPKVMSYPKAKFGIVKITLSCVECARRRKE